MKLKISDHAAKQLEVKSYPDVLSVKQASEILGIGRVSIYHLIENNQLMAFRKGRTYFIPKQAIKTFLSNNNIGGANHDR